MERKQTERKVKNVGPENAKIPFSQIMRMLLYIYKGLKSVQEFVNVCTFEDNPPGKRSRNSDVRDPPDQQP